VQWERLSLFVQPRVQEFAGLEVGGAPAREFDRSASFRVPPGARLAMSIREGTEASDFDAISSGKCIADRREDGFNNSLDIAISQMRVQFCDPFD
jgi:hypothetical protein